MEKGFQTVKNWNQSLKEQTTDSNFIWYVDKGAKEEELISSESDYLNKIEEESQLQKIKKCTNQILSSFKL